MKVRIYGSQSDQLPLFFERSGDLLLRRGRVVDVKVSIRWIRMICIRLGHHIGSVAICVTILE
jgi:hypothetical protein